MHTIKKKKMVCNCKHTNGVLGYLSWWLVMKRRDRSEVEVGKVEANEGTGRAMTIGRRYPHTVRSKVHSVNIFTMYYDCYCPVSAQTIGFSATTILSYLRRYN